MRKLSILAFMACSLVSTLTFSGCGNSRPEGDLPQDLPPITEEQAKAKAKEVMDGMKGQYKGAPKK